MYCGQCGNEMAEGARFCSACGAPLHAAAAGGTAAAGAGWTTTPSGTPPVWSASPGAGDWVSRLQRPRTGRMVAGVCAGLARQYHWDLTWTRVITLLIAVFSSGAGVVAYLVFWIIMPEEPWALGAGIPVAASPAAPPPGTPPEPPPPPPSSVPL